MARNAAIDELRSKQHQNSCKTETLAEKPIDGLIGKAHLLFNQEIIGVKQLLEKLKPEQQSILELVYFKGYTHVEVAEYLQLPLGSVKTKIRLSILTLRQYFNETHSKKEGSFA